MGQIVNLRADCLSALGIVAQQVPRIWQIPCRLRNCLTLFAVCAVAWGLSAPEQAALERISADSLRANLSYLASDELEGRDTPSHGLDLAADYIAKQFQQAGLAPAAGDSFFQNAKFDQATVNLDGFQLKLTSGGHEVKPGREEAGVRSVEEIDLTNAPVLKLPGNGAIPQVAGMIVAGDERRWEQETFLNELQARKPALILLIGKSRQARFGASGRPLPFLTEEDGDHAPVIRVHDSDAAALLASKSDMKVTVHLARPAVKHVALRNVAGLLKGSDPALRNEYVLLTAHYDHLGRTAKGIYHGANDNGSGTVSVIEIARALAAMNPHPKRSILFMTVFGEEEGLLGSYYYAHHPLEPLKDTVAGVNLEQMGRTDDPSGREVRAFGISGTSFSDLPDIMGQAAKAEGITMYRRRDADDYFDRSDNYSLAQFGIVAHTIAVAFEFPDYHAVGDVVGKIDFVNMVAVDRGVAAGIVELADEPNVPHWSEGKGAAPYRNAGR